MSQQLETSFTVNIKGEFTEEQWAGSFKIKTKLSHRDNLKQDQIRRELIGNKPDGAYSDVQGTATIFAFLQTYIIDAPKWWRENGEGLDLLDSNVAIEVWNAAIKRLKELQDEKTKAAEEAKAALAKG
jgi:hypothetical protein